jgi:CRP-like cAMP-binding protein
MRIDTIPAICNNNLFKDSNLLCLNTGRNLGSLVTLKKGEIIYAEGDEPEGVYLVINGKVVLKKSDGSLCSIFSKNDFLGAKELFADILRCTTAYALRDSILLQLSKREISFLTENDYNILLNIQKGNKDFKFDSCPIKFDENSSNNFLHESPVFSEKEMNKILCFIATR